MKEEIRSAIEMKMSECKCQFINFCPIFLFPVWMGRKHGGKYRAEGGVRKQIISLGLAGGGGAGRWSWIKLLATLYIKLLIKVLMDRVTAKMWGFPAEKRQLQVYRCLKPFKPLRAKRA